MLPFLPEALVLKHPVTDLRGNITRRIRVFYKNGLELEWQNIWTRLRQFRTMGPHVPQTLEASRAEKRIRRRRVTATVLT
jgi:hypothetical protein